MKASQQLWFTWLFSLALYSFGQTNIHLHTNKEGYTAGESLWFSAYLTDSISGNLQKNREPLFVQIFVPNGKLANEQIVFTQNGRGAGVLKLNKAWSGGVYRLRAFTRAMFPKAYQKQVIVQQPNDKTLAYIPPTAPQTINWPQPLKVNIGVEKYFFAHREAIHIKIRATDAQNRPVQGTFSMSVSELMSVGTQENNSVLNELKPSKDSTRAFQRLNVGLKYEGQIIDQKTRAGIAEASLVFMAVGTENHFTRTVNSDSKGFFVLDDLPVVGEQSVSYQINNKKGNALENATVAWQRFPPKYELPALNYEQVKINQTQQEKQWQNAQQPDGELYANFDDKGIQLGEVEVKTKAEETINEVGINKLHKNYSFAKDFDPRYPLNMGIEGMALMVGGVSIASNGIRINGTMGVPLIIVDGLPFNININSNDITRIEIIRGADAVIYGSAGVNGVVFVYTRRFNPKYNVTPKTKIATLKGFALAKPFYFPNHNQPQAVSDNRLTLYWNPEISTDANGEAVVSFYASDVSGNFKIMVEGMSQNNAGMATKLIRVDAKK